ncbi:MAG: IS200/IS605 family transposase [Clostridiales bacterium]|jgi:putative transposase|nr:IS200/IS605 family transposase [Clostridiales bacterium]
MSNVNSPVISDIKYHFAWHTKFRSPLLVGNIKKRLQEILRQDCKQEGIEILGGLVGKDYVYMRIKCPARLAPSKIAQLLKGRSSRLMQEEYPDIKNDLRLRGSLWNDGYLCYTFGEATEEDIREIIGW